jgi:hypothetical protein
VLLALAGPGIPADLVSWAVMPKAPAGTPPSPVRHGPVFGNGNGAVAGVALLLFAASLVSGGGLFDREVLLPGLLIGGGVWLLVRDQEADQQPGTTGAVGGSVGEPGTSRALAPWQGTTAGAVPGDVPGAPGAVVPAS